MGEKGYQPFVPAYWQSTWWQATTGTKVDRILQKIANMQYSLCYIIICP